MINSQMYSLNSNAGISSTFLSSFLLPKTVSKSFTSCCVFSYVALFSCSAIKLSTEPTPRKPFLHPQGLFIWARLTGLARFPRSHLTSKSFVKTLMCSYERAVWLGYRDLGFSNRDLGKRAGNFGIWTLHPGYREENNTMHFRDRTDVTQLLILFSSILKLGIVLFDS